MINKEYWDNFYNKNKVTTIESNFAKYVLKYINDNNIDGKLIDIACGNGRDSVFFHKNKVDTTGIDLSIEIDNSTFNFIKGNLLDFDYSGYDLFYLRFVVHALKEEEFDSFINKILKLKKRSLIFIETRSSRDITNEEKSETFFKSSIGDKHFRLLYSKKYLDDKLSKSFNILESSEGKYSKFGSDDPYCLRYILGNF
jgi:hypothetical protein